MISYTDDIYMYIYIHIVEVIIYVTANVVIFPIMWGLTATSRLILTHPNANILSQKTLPLA